MLKLVVAACAAVVIAAGQDARAVMLGISTESLTRESDLVVEGVVERVESYWSSDGKQILSSATVSVLETVRGGGNRTIVRVEYLGGEVGDIGMGVSDIRPFKQGEQMLLFLKQRRVDHKGEVHELVGLSQGMYSVGKDRVARKSGFSLAAGQENVENNVDIDRLKARVRGIR